MDDLKTVARRKPRISPPSAGKDLQVSLDRHTVATKIKSVEKVGHRQPIGNLPGLPVHFNIHHAQVTTLGLGGGGGGRLDFTGPNPSDDEPVLVFQKVLEFVIGILRGADEFELRSLNRMDNSAAHVNRGFNPAFLPRLRLNMVNDAVVLDIGVESRHHDERPGPGRRVPAAGVVML